MVKMLIDGTALAAKEGASGSALQRRTNAKGADEIEHSTDVVNHLHGKPLGLASIQKKLQSWHARPPHHTESAARHEEVIQPLRLSATGLTVARR